MSTHLSYGKNVKLEGVSRDQRFDPALDPKLVRIDERKLEDFLTYLQQYNSNVLFVDTDQPFNTKKTWDEFFLQEPSFLMARIVSKDPAEISTAFDTLHTQFQQNPSVENLFNLAAFVHERFQKVDRWYASVSDHPFEDTLALYIRSYLSVDLQKLLHIINYLPYGTQYSDLPKRITPLKNKNGIWDTERSLTSADQVFVGTTEEEKLESASFFVSEIFNNVFFSTQAIVNYCKEYFLTGIFSSGDHNAHVALFIAFSKLFGYAQEELNKLPERILDFYYKRVLQATPRPPMPDQAFLVAELTRGFDQFDIPKGTLLSAGKDRQNAELLYKADKDMIVTKAQVQSLRTLNVVKENEKKLGYYAGILKRSGGETSSLKNAVALSKIFGEKKGRIATGFAIASKQFYLAKGDRNIKVSFLLSDDLNRESYTPDAFIALRFTGENGWLDQRNKGDYITIHSLKKTAPKTLELNFSISIAQSSAVVAYNPNIHAGDYRTVHPIMQVVLNFPGTGAPSELVDQVNELLSIRIEAVSVKVEVGSAVSKLAFNGVRDLILENHDAVLEATKPFYPFSTLPKVGSSFYIGCPDLFYKDVEKFSVNIEWMLPDNFQSYYEKYFPPYDSNKFRATLSILQEKKWGKINDISLIDTNENGGRFRMLRVDMTKLNGQDTDSSEPQVSKFSTSMRDGTVRLKLLYPDFGHNIYPQLITSTVLEKSTSKSAVVDYYGIVKKQLYDSVISIKMPDDIANRNGTLRIVVYDILEKIPDNQRARGMIITGLSEKLKQFNGSDVVFRDLKEKLVESLKEEAENKVVVNDDSFINRMLGFLKRIRLIDRDIHFDKDNQDVGDVALKLKDKISNRASMMLPTHWELASLILNEINNAISQIVIRIVDEILAQRKNTMPDGVAVEGIFKRHIDDANEVINDMIARKIAILLSANDIPPAPYTPQINSLAISYISTRTLIDGEDQFFHITPFGIAEINPLRKISTESKIKNKVFLTDRLFPLTASGQDTSADDEGQLFIGVADAVPMQTLSLFFHLEDADIVADYKLPMLTWWYLCYNQWYRLPDNAIASDSTYGLQTSGIVELNLPADITKANTLFDETGLFWLRVCVVEHSNAFPFLHDVKAQAFSATFIENDNDPEHYALPLPPFKIKAFAEPMSGIKSVKQPVASLPGKMQEAPQEFYTRVSERLRHKQRAVNAWDYERLLLEEFPFIYKVNCINNYFQRQFVPGHVTVVPIANLKNTGDTLSTPKASYLNLRKIEQFLQERTSPFVKVHAINPEINFVLIRCKVRLKSEKNKGHYLRQLNEELRSFLTPWASTTGEASAYSAKIYASSVISFIDSRDYVSFVTDIEMNQYKKDQSGNRTYIKGPNGALSLFETVTMAPDEITASAPEHQIELL
ncbi:MAG TPA: baseplate J/gp47 family protein [Chitinophagaceae bacterium]